MRRRCRTPISSSAPRASCACRTSCSGRARTPSSCSRTRCGRTSARMSSGRQSRTTQAAAVDSAADERGLDGAHQRAEAPALPAPGAGMTNFVNRVLVAVVGLPVVLGAVWAGGWWLFALVAIAGAIAVHEFVVMARPLAPLAPLGAERGGVVWMVGGFLTCFLLSFVLNTLAKTRPPATAAIGATVLAAAWIGFGLGHLVLLRRMHEQARLIAFTVLLVVFAADTFAYFGGRVIGRHKLAPTLSPDRKSTRLNSSHP